jgi:hypothetical protein
MPRRALPIRGGKSAESFQVSKNVVSVIRRHRRSQPPSRLLPHARLVFGRCIRTNGCSARSTKQGPHRTTLPWRTSLLMMSSGMSLGEARSPGSTEARNRSWRTSDGGVGSREGPSRSPLRTSSRTMRSGWSSHAARQCSVGRHGNGERMASIASETARSPNAGCFQRTSTSSTKSGVDYQPPSSTSCWRQTQTWDARAVMKAMVRRGHGHPCGRGLSDAAALDR